uniref:Uncharacterized protein LOC109505855 n=1 Tax=Elaeis guineensis var. tenera TaxID=51953 RepID=A0A8N4F5I3_ELAGV|nr:uncharacterized protein LOC109505855 [Elaeis guineensis]
MIRDFSLCNKWSKKNIYCFVLFKSYNFLFKDNKLYLITWIISWASLSFDLDLIKTKVKIENSLYIYIYICALNHDGHTVFLYENEYYIAHLEGRLLGLEA